MTRMASTSSQKVTTLSRPKDDGISVLDSTFESKDMTIVASSGEKIKASCLQLSVASHYLRFIFSTTSCSGFIDEPPVLLLPEFTPEVVHGFLKYVTRGFHQCADAQEMSLLQELISTLRINVAEDIELATNGGAGKSAKRKNSTEFRNDSKRAKVSGEESSQESSNVAGGVYGSILNPERDLHIKLEVPDDEDQVEYDYENPISAQGYANRVFDSTPVCPTCYKDMSGPIDDSVQHIRDVMALRGETNYKIPNMGQPMSGEPGARYFCAICHARHFKDQDLLKKHLKRHMAQVHEGQLKCEKCAQQFETVGECFLHRATHNNKKFDPTKHHVAYIEPGPRSHADQLKAEAKLQNEVYWEQLKNASNGDKSVRSNCQSGYVKRGRVAGQQESECPVCHKDVGGSVDQSVQHIRDVMALRGEANYQIPSMSEPLSEGDRARYFCKICHNRDFKNPDQLRSHLIKHMGQAHDGQRECEKCHLKFETVGEYFVHRATHNTRKIGPQHTVAFISKDPRCSIFNNRPYEDPMANCDFCLQDQGSHPVATYIQHIRDVMCLRGEENYQIHHMDEQMMEGFKTFKCKVCAASVEVKNFRSHLKKHVVQAHRGQTECDKCDTKLDSVGEYFTHRATHVAEKRRSVLYNKECPTCKKTFQSNSQHFKECVLRAKGEYIICDQCSFKTLFPASMRHHHAKFHGGEEPLKCSQCNWTTLTQGRLDHHIRRKHPKPGEEVVCEDCGEVFESVSARCHHRRDKHRKLTHVYQCNVCGQTSKVQSHLFRHILLHLPDYQAYHCSLCSEKFRTEIKGTAHKHKVHGGNGTIKMVTTSEIEQFRKQMVSKKPVDGISDAEIAQQKSFKRFRGSVAENPDFKIEIMDHPTTP